MGDRPANNSQEPGLLSCLTQYPSQSRIRPDSGKYRRGQTQGPIANHLRKKRHLVADNRDILPPLTRAKRFRDNTRYGRKPAVPRVRFV